MLRGIVIGMVMALPVVAQTPAPPTIPDTDKLAYFKAQAALQQAQNELQKSVEKVNQDCGAKHQPQLNDKGDIVCVANKPIEPSQPQEPKK